MENLQVRVFCSFRCTSVDGNKDFCGGKTNSFFLAVVTHHVLEPQPYRGSPSHFLEHGYLHQTNKPK